MWLVYINETCEIHQIGKKMIIDFTFINIIIIMKAAGIIGSSLLLGYIMEGRRLPGLIRA
jgi:hypothetical protein